MTQLKMYGQVYTDPWGQKLLFQFNTLEERVEQIVEVAKGLISSCKDHPLRAPELSIEDPIGNDLIIAAPQEPFIFVNHFLVRADFLYDFVKEIVGIEKVSPGLDRASAEIIVKAIYKFRDWIPEKCLPLLKGVEHEVDLYPRGAWVVNNIAFLEIVGE